MNRIAIEETCTGCGVCVRACPVFCLQAGEGAVPRIVDERRCIACGQCVALCPVRAVAHREFTADRIEAIHRDRLPSADQVAELLRSRRSVRNFRDAAVPRAVIGELFDAAQLAPSTHNRRLTRYTVIDDPASRRWIAERTARTLARLSRMAGSPVGRLLLRLAIGRRAAEVVAWRSEMEEMAGAVAAGEDPILRKAPVVVFAHHPRGHFYDEIDAALALHNVALTCPGVGLGAFMNGWVMAACRSDPAIGRRLGVPRGDRILAVLVLGYPRFEYRWWPRRRPAEVRWGPATPGPG